MSARVFWRFASDAGTASANSTEDGYPVTNPQRVTLASVWQSDGTEATDIYTIDLGSAQAVTAMATLNHNFEAADVLTLRYASNAAFDADVGTQSITWAETDIYHYASSVTRRYWRLEIDKDTPANTVQIGRFVLGAHTGLTYSLGYGGAIGIGEDTAKRVLTEGGQIYGDVGVSRTRMDSGLIVTAAERTEIETLRDTFQSVTPFIYSDDWENYPTLRSIYGVFDVLGSPRQVTPSHWQYAWSLVQQR